MLVHKAEVDSMFSDLQVVAKPASVVCTFEPRHEKTNILHMRKQRRRSALRLPRS